MSHKKHHYLSAIILFTFFSFKLLNAQDNDFKSDLCNHLLDMHTKFSVFYFGEAQPFLAELNSLVTTIIDSLVTENVVVKSYNYTTRYSSSKVKVSFNVEYDSMTPEILPNEKQLTEFVFKSLAEKKENFSAGLAGEYDDESQTLAERVFENANAKLENTFHQVQVSTFDCTFNSYDNYLQFNFGIIYVLPELLSNEYAYTDEDLSPLIYNNLKKRNSDFAIHLLSGQGKFNVFAAYTKSVMNDVYLKNSIKSMSYRTINFARSKIAVFDMDYLATSEEENYVDARTDKIISEIISDEMDDYQKVKAVHDYIILNVSYEDDKEYESAYDALVKSKALCSGYTLLASKFFEKLGLKSLIVDSPEMKHAWNMVNLENKWYHIDLTWDDPVPDVKGRVVYNYFLVSDYELNRRGDKKHTWNRSEYPRAKDNYPVSFR